jgi:hypothetical protein
VFTASVTTIPQVNLGVNDVSWTYMSEYVNVIGPNDKFVCQDSRAYITSTTELQWASIDPASTNAHSYPKDITQAVSSNKLDYDLVGVIEVRDDKDVVVWYEFTAFSYVDGKVTKFQTGLKFFMNYIGYRPIYQGTVLAGYAVFTQNKDPSKPTI